jgi:hypothetical protein
MFAAQQKAGSNDYPAVLPVKRRGASKRGVFFGANGLFLGHSGILPTNGARSSCTCVRNRRDPLCRDPQFAAGRRFRISCATRRP